MRSFRMVLAVVAGCGEGTIALDDASAPVGPAPTTVDVRDPGDVGLPPSLQCVSVASQGAAGPEVTRLWVATADRVGTVYAQLGPQFWSHGGQFAAAAPYVEHPVIVDGGRLSDGAGLELRLRRDGLVVRGLLVDGDAASRVTCWSELELFGSPWAGVEGTLTAHFDWATGDCRDADGQLALNPLPIEVIRETAWGECADLRGAALNGDDLGMPDLGGWFLPGARLDGASLFFARVDGATLNGARLADLAYGYATIAGSVDEFTELPDACETTTSPWSGSYTTCSQ